MMRLVGEGKSHTQPARWEAGAKSELSVNLANTVCPKPLPVTFPQKQLSLLQTFIKSPKGPETQTNSSWSWCAL